MSSYTFLTSDLPRGTLLFVSSGIILGLMVISVMYTFFFSPLRAVPGPWLARTTRLWELVMVSKGNFNQRAIHLHKKYDTDISLGPVVRIAPNKYEFNTLESVKTIYSMTKTFPKSAYYEAFSEPHNQTLFSFRDTKAHAESRRSMASLYSMTTLISYEYAVDHQNTILREEMLKFANKRTLVSLPQFLQFYAFDVISEITFGESFSLMHLTSDSPYFFLIDMLDKSFSMSSKIGLLPELWPSILKCLRFFNKPSPVTLLKISEGYLAKYREESRAIKGNTNDEPFVAKIIGLEAKGKMTRWDAIGVCSSNVAAGSDTTAITLSSALYHIYKDPKILQRLREELDTMENNGKISNPVTFQQAQNMPYLQAVVKEALRVHPAVGVPLVRVVPEGGAEINGYFFPEGTEVGVNAWALNYNEDVYGHDAHVFRPERWFASTPGTESSAVSLFAFGGGARTCIGKNISLLEMYKVLPQIVREFNIEISEDTMPWSTECNWFVKQKYLVTVKLRERGPVK